MLNKYPTTLTAYYSVLMFPLNGQLTFVVIFRYIVYRGSNVFWLLVFLDEKKTQNPISYKLSGSKTKLCARFEELISERYASKYIANALLLKKILKVQ